MRRQRISKIEREMFLRAFVRTARPSTHVISQIAELLEEEYAPAGTVLYAKGQPSLHSIWILEGVVELRDGELAPYTFGPRSTVGGLDAFQHQPYSRDCVVVEDATIFRLNVEHWLEVLEDNFDFAKGMLDFLFMGLDTLTERLGFEDSYGALECQPSISTPSQPSDEFGFIDGLLSIRHDPLFRSISVQVAVRLAEHAQVLKLPRGVELWGTVHAASSVFWLTDGRIGIERRDDPKWRGSFTPGQGIGIFAAFSDREQRYRTFAEVNSELIAVSKEHFLDVMEDHPALMRSILSFTAASRQQLVKVATARGISTSTP